MFRLSIAYSATMVWLLLVPSLVHAVTMTDLQSNAGNEGAFNANVANTPTDLINNGNPKRTSAVYAGTESGGGGFVALTDGLTLNSNIGNSAYFKGDEKSATFTFDTVLNPLGYDITQIRSIAGWRDSLAYSNQQFSVEYLLVGALGFTAPELFVVTPFPDGDVDGSEPPNSSQFTIFDSSGVLKSGVAAIRFRFNENTNDSLSSYQDGTVYKELKVQGVATVPEPGSVALLGLGALLALPSLRKRLKVTRAI